MWRGHTFWVFSGIFLILGQATSASVESQVVHTSRDGRHIKFPLLEWLFGAPNPSSSVSTRNITAAEGKTNKTLSNTGPPLQRILPVEEIPVRNSTFKRFVLKKEAQDQLNDEIYLHNHEKFNSTKSEVVSSTTTVLALDVSSSTTTPKTEDKRQRSGRQFFRGGPHEQFSAFEPYRRGNWHHHRRKHHRSAPGPEFDVPMDVAASPSSLLMKRQGIFAMTLTPQQQMLLQQAAILQRQQQQLLAMSGLSGLAGNSALEYYLRNNAANVNGNGNGNFSRDKDKDKDEGNGGTRKRRRPSSYYDYEDSDEHEDYYDDDDGDGDDGSEFDSEELVQDFLTPEF